MSSSEKFCLRWNDFESNISVAFRELREDKDFFDVTLACDDEQIQAHKVILSACSPFFRTILRRNPHQHPLLYLRGVKHTDLQSVLNFMYHGEVNVAQEELNSFLAVAEDLKVKGLTQNSTSSSKRPKSPAPLKPSPRPLERDPTPAPKRPRFPPSNPGTNSYSQDDDDIQEVIPVKTEPRDTSVIPPPPPPNYPTSTPSSSTAPPPPSQALEVQSGSLTHYDGGEGYEDYGGYEDETGYEGGMVDHSMTGAEGNKERYEMLLEFIRTNTGVGNVCLVCGKQCGKLHAVQYHIESAHGKHFNVTYTCEVCHKQIDTKNAYITHKSRNHKKIKDADLQLHYM